MKLNEFDVIFISYDEPNADINFIDLENKVPWAKRVHGVKGFDAAHKQAANYSETPYFITVDADNIVDPVFFDQDFSLDLQNTVCYSWAAINIINGLRYGNGGLKLWQRDFVLNMKTHEIADDKNHKVDFCWQKDYIHLNQSFSWVHNNSTPYQAWRAGFREGIKLSLDRGKRIKPENINSLDKYNLTFIRQWMTVGRDANNGIWSIVGARQAFYKCLTDNNWDHTIIIDYDYMNDYWQKIMNENPEQLAMDYFQKIKTSIDIHIVELDYEQSKFFKEQQLLNGI